jgi:hypothetical protein
MDIKDVNLNSSESMGQLGHKLVSSTTKIFNNGQHIAVITVTAGTATVTGKQHVNNPEGLDIYEDWSAVVLPVGTWIVNLKGVTIVTTGLTIAYYGA